MNEPTTVEREKRGGSSGAAHCSAWVYSGPHYGRKHKIIRRTETLVWVEYQGDKFAVPFCDVEECEGCDDKYMGKTAYTPDDVALCPKCAAANTPNGPDQGRRANDSKQP